MSSKLSPYPSNHRAVSAVKVRPIRPLDYQAVVKVIQESITDSWRHIYPSGLIEAFCRKYDLSAFVKKARETNYWVAVERVSDKIVGIIGLKDNQLRTFFVHPRYQGRGVGRRLYDRLEEKARELGYKELVLESSPLGEPIYKKFGFKTVGVVEKKRAGFKYSDARMIKLLE